MSKARRSARLMAGSKLPDAKAEAASEAVAREEAELAPVKTETERHEQKELVARTHGRSPRPRRRPRSRRLLLANVCRLEEGTLRLWQAFYAKRGRVW